MADAKIRELLLDKFIVVEGLFWHQTQRPFSSCCGGKGLAVGCPRCGRIWPA